MRSKIGRLSVGVALAAQVTVLAAESPVAVSPGSATGTVIDGRCPTFSWGQVQRARSYELVVYAIEDLSKGDGLDLSSMKKVLEDRMPGSALVWTPPLSRCLSAGESYAWALRARVATGWSDWSEVKLFRVDPGPSLGEVEQALGTLNRFLAAGGRTAAGAAPVEIPRARRTTLTSSASGASDASDGEPPERIQVETDNAVDTALQAESSLSLGKTFGVHGISVSPDAESAGVVGEATSAAGFGGIFKNTAAGGAGLIAVGGTFDAADIILGKTDCGSGGDNGLITSDPVCNGSDIFLRAKDAVVAQIGQNQSEAGNFVVQAVQDIDGVRRDVFDVNESGELLLGIFGTGRGKLTKDALELNVAEDRVFDFRNVGTGKMTLQVDGDSIPPTNSVRGDEVSNGSLDLVDIAGGVLSLTFNPGPVAANTCLSLNKAFAGVETGDVTFAVPSAGVDQNLLVFPALATSNNNVRVKICNITGTQINGADNTWTFFYFD